MSHYKGSADDRCLAQRQSLLGDRGYDTDWFRDALARRGIAASIPPKANRQVPIFHDAALYRQRHKIKICSTGRSEEHTSELQSLMRISYAGFCLNKKKTNATLTKSMA